ncbi:MAG: aldehyde ferredoxin oxidoreductase family protein [Chloroflexi bacterium]|nr:aldehyde ferredoxin oxidoreductase family protein [Chloroflexota bacterium]
MSTKNGYIGRILTVDLTSRSSEVRDLPEDLASRFLGARGFGAKLLYDLLPPETDPLSADNLLILATGPLTGTASPTGSKLSIISRSPATRGYGDSTIGGHIGPEIKFAGYDVIILRGLASTPVTLSIEDNKVQFMDASALWGLGCFETESRIKDNLGEETQVLCIGPAGENLVNVACIGHDFGRQAGRTGMGAIMGSKKVKAIAVRGSGSIHLADPAEFRSQVSALYKRLQELPSTKQWREGGTAEHVIMSNEVGCLPTRNFQSGWFEHAESISGELMRQTRFVKNKACFGCSVVCGTYCVIDDGPYAGTRVDGPEYEILALLGSNCGISNLDAVIRANYLCDDLGLDAISTGNIVAFAMECYERGIVDDSATGGQQLRFGNEPAYLWAIEAIAHREGIGDTLAQGVRSAAAVIGKGSESFAMHAKGLEQSGYETRGGMGQVLGYAIVDRGSDHNRVWQMDFFVGDWDTPQGKAALVKQSQIRRSTPDILGQCRFVSYSLELDDYAALVSAATGKKRTGDDLALVTERVFNLTRVINGRFGFTRKDDSAPRRIFSEPVPDGPKKGSLVNPADFDSMLEEFYAISGWDNKGVPSDDTLMRLDLSDLIPEAAKLRQ